MVQGMLTCQVMGGLETGAERTQSNMHGDFKESRESSESGGYMDCDLWQKGLKLDEMPYIYVLATCSRGKTSQVTTGLAITKNKAGYEVWPHSFSSKTQYGGLKNRILRAAYKISDLSGRVREVSWVEYSEIPVQLCTTGFLSFAERDPAQ
jgi:hypothetical protein